MAITRLSPVLAVLRESVIFWTGISIIIWVFPSKAIHDLLIYGAFIWALIRCPRHNAWVQPAGLAFLVVLGYTLLSLPLAAYPALALRDFVKQADIVAGAFAIAILFPDRPRIEAALFFSALGIGLTISFDIGRLVYHLGPDLLAKAHAFKPFVLNHSNVSSMMAGLAAFVFFYFFWKWRGRPWPAAGCAAAVGICLMYLVIMASRGPQLAFGLAAATLGLLVPGWRAKILWLAGLALVGGLLLVNIEHVNPRFMEKASLTTFSERDKVWQHTWELTRQHPWRGFGYGKKTFEAVYYASDPPPSVFHYPHCHQYWLKLLFEFGWPGVFLYLSAWLILAAALGRRILTCASFTDRLLPGTVGLMLLLTHVYGLGDYPDNIIQTAQIWLIPVALVLIQTGSRRLPPVADGRDQHS